MNFVRFAAWVAFYMLLMGANQPPQNSSAPDWFGLWLMLSQAAAVWCIARFFNDDDRDYEKKRERRKNISCFVLFFNFIAYLYFARNTAVSGGEMLFLAVLETVGCGTLFFCDNDSIGLKRTGLFLLVLVALCSCQDECGYYPETKTCIVKSVGQKNFPRILAGLKRGADPSLQVSKKSLLEHAVEGGSADVTDFLLKKGQPVKASMYLTADSVSAVVLDMLLNTKKNMDVALIYAARENRARLSGKLANAGANVNFQDKAGDTALMIAVDRGFDVLAETLLPFKPKMNIKNKKGETALIKAVKQEKPSLCRKFLPAGAKPNIADNTGNAPLSYAVKKNNIEIIKLLLQKGADVRQKNNRGEIPIMNTINLKIIKLLKQKGSPLPEGLADKVLDKNGDAFNDEYLEIFHGE